MNFKGCCCCGCCCCCNNGSQTDLSSLVAMLISRNTATKTLDSTGSVGLNIRAVIKNGSGTIKEITPTEINTGTNQIPYTNLENGDIVCIQVSDDTTFNFGDFVETCITIPTPTVGFVLP